ncbi:MAG: peptide deformylase [Chitinophagales bacterium]|nr:peptide deformylase [Bacteroidota bacterium]MBX7141405.1 peptide deformylase [Chitinophagales bacterium]
MILPIVAYGDGVLRKRASDINPDYPGLEQLIADMFETMQSASGIGLAAPQIGRSIRLFVVDTETAIKHFREDEEEESPFKNETGIRRIFINAKAVNKNGNPFSYNEGCLSIPKIREDIDRPGEITLEYLDEKFQAHRETFKGLAGRVIQHEYDHIEGVLFIDYLKPLKKRLIKKKLENISRGEVEVDYKMKFPLRK